MTWSNSDYVSDCPTSALNNLKIKVVDGNLEPIKFLNPVYVTVMVQEIPDKENTKKDESFNVTFFSSCKKSLNCPLKSCKKNSKNKKLERVLAISKIEDKFSCDL